MEGGGALYWVGGGVEGGCSYVKSDTFESFPVRFAHCAKSVWELKVPPPFEVSCGAAIRGPGDKILDQDFQVQGV